MAKLGGITLVDKDTSHESGAAFLLSQSSQINETIEVSSSWEIEVKATSPYVVVRGRGIKQQDVYDQAYESVQKGLDLLFATRNVSLTTVRVAEEYLIWWHEGTVQVLRAVFTTPITFRLDAKIRVLDKEGKDITQPAPAVIDHEALRYIRRAQATNELFDAFRNMYLAFEQLLSLKYPRQVNEGEGAWLKRALEAVNQTISLSRAFTPSTADIVSEIHQGIYKDIRCALFHAKDGDYILIPDDIQGREAVSEGLDKLTSIVLLLAQKWLHVRRSNTWVYPQFFHERMEEFLAKTTTFVTDDRTLLRQDLDILDENALKSCIEMDANYDLSRSQPGFEVMLASIDAGLLGALGDIAGVILADGDRPLIFGTLEAELTFDYINRFETQMVIRLGNLHRSKYLYSA